MYVRTTTAPCNTDYVGDVGGQKTLRSYWRNYFEKTDALIWVVDATDRLRIEDCRDELHGLLQEEVRSDCIETGAGANGVQRLGGASLLIFANKTDVEGCMDEEEILTVRRSLCFWTATDTCSG